MSRVLRVFGEPNRPPDWYSQKQCAVQYNSLLSNVGTPKRKKRSEKGVETVDTPGESIVRKLTQGIAIKYIHYYLIFVYSEYIILGQIFGIILEVEISINS